MAAALLSKASVIGLPLLWIATARSRQDVDRRILVSAAATLSLLAVAVAAVTRVYQHGQQAAVDPGAPAWLGTIGAATSAHVARLGSLGHRGPLVPTLFDSPGSAELLVGVATAVTLVAVLVWFGGRAARGPALPPGGVIALGGVLAYLPVSGVPGALEMFASDRYLLLPLAVAGAPAVALAVDAAARRVAQLTPRVARVATALLVVVLLGAGGALAGLRARALEPWRDGVSLWAAAADDFAPTERNLASGAFLWACRQRALATGAYVVGYGVPAEPDPARRRVLLDETNATIAACLTVGRPDCDTNPRGCAVYDQLVADRARGTQLDATTPR